MGKLSKPGTIERIIEAISPKWAYSRARSRKALQFSRKYQAASKNKRVNRWGTAATSANTETKNALSVLRARSRDMIRNNPYAKRGQNILVSAIVGDGISPQAQDSPSHDALWAKWGNKKLCDSEGHTNFHGLQALVMRSIIESGACLIRRHRMPSSDELPVPLQIQVLEPDFIDISIDSVLSSGGNIVQQGIEINKQGRPVAYYLFDEHPGEATRISSFTSRRIPASEILHIYLKDRPGQLHGVPWFHSVLMRLKDFDEYEDARLMQMKIACCFAAFVSDVDSASTEEDIELPDKIEPARIETLPPGRTVEFAKPPNTENVGEFAKTALHGISAGMGVTYESLTTDLKNVNFTSGRMGRLDFFGQVDLWQWNMVIPQLCEEVWKWFNDAGRIAGVLRTDVEADWTTPARALVDPGKEIEALKKEVRSGFITPSKAVRKRGYDPEKHWDEFEKDLAEIDKRKLIFDIDPRNIGGGGTAQSADFDEESERALSFIGRELVLKSVSRGNNGGSSV